MSVFVCLLISLGLYVPGAVCVCVACGHDTTTHKTTGGQPMTDQVPGWARDTYDRVAPLPAPKGGADRG